jgi:PKD repeat protein
MKKILLQFLVTCFLTTVVGCTSSENEDSPTTTTPPTANFSFTSTNLTAPASIVFENKSTNATNYVWDFGDNSANSLDKNPSHTYTSAGTYTVELIVTGEGGTAIKTQTIQINAPIKPTSAKITNITVTEISWIDENSKAWDSSDGPDIQFYLVDTDTYKEQTSSVIYNNVSKSQFPLSWTNMPAKNISNLSKSYDLSIDEIDGVYGYNMAMKTFKLLDYTTGSNAYPNKITLEYIDPNPFNPSPKTTFILDVTWQ